MSSLSDKEIFDLVYPQALDCVRGAMQDISHNTRSQIDGLIPHDEPKVELSGESVNKSLGNGRFNRHYEIGGTALVDAHQPVNAGESWLIGFNKIAEGAAKTIVTGVLLSLGREDVEIAPTLLNGGEGDKISTRTPKRQEEER